MAMKQQIEITAKDKTKAAASSVKRSLGGVSSAASSMGAQLGLAFGIGGMAFAIKQSLDAADKIQKLSIRLGASTEALSEYEHVAKLSGIRVETLNMGWQRMTRRVAEAAAGTGEAKGALEELNVSATDLNNLRPEQQFEVLADALNNVENQADKVRLAMKLFDSEGVSLLQTMENGAEGIRDMRKEAQALGLSLSRDQVDAAAAANDAIERMTAANSALTTQMAIEFAPTIEAVAEFLGKNLPEAADFTSKAFGGIRKAMGLAVAGITTGLIELYDVLEELPGGFGAPYAAAKQEMELFRDAVFTTIDQISEKQAEAASVGIGGGNEEEKKSIAAQMFGTEEEIQDDMDMALDMIDKQFDSLDTLYATRLAGLNKIQKDSMTEREKFMAKSAKGQTKQVVGEMITMTQGVAQQNKVLFNINKTAAIANAVVNAWQGAARTMGEYPYPFNIALAGLSLASGLAQVQSIKGTSFGGGGGGGGISGGGGVPSMAGTVPASALPAPEDEENGKQDLNITITGGLHTDEDVRNLVNKIGEVSEDMGTGTRLVAVVG